MHSLRPKNQRTCRDADPPRLGTCTSSDDTCFAACPSSFSLARPLIVATRPEFPLIRSYSVVFYIMWATRSLAAASVLARLAFAVDFDWSAVEPSEQLKYHPCYDGFQCARLSVPYDPLSSLITMFMNARFLTLSVLQTRLAGYQQHQESRHRHHHSLRHSPIK